MKTLPDFNKLFKPSSLAVIGASKDKFKGGGRFLYAFKNDGYKGKLYPVNPKQNNVMGLKSYPGILDVPGKVDLAYIAVPSSVVPGVIADCHKKGVAFAVVHSAGFSELGEEGRELERKVLAAAENGVPRIIGPNCMGIYSPSARIKTVVEDYYPDDPSGPVAFIGQSGWVPYNVLELGRQRGIRFNKAISIGNQSDITLEDFLEYLGSDEKTKVIAFYIEGLKHGRKFMELAKEISKSKPIIVWKGGRSPIGTRAVASHTGSLAGNNAVFNAAMKQCGVSVVGSIEELVDLMAVLTCPFLPQGNRIGVLAESGGGGVAVADSANEFGLAIPTLSEARQQELFKRLHGLIPPFSMPKNPVDLVWPPMENRVKILVDCAEIILQETDSLIILDYAVFGPEYVREMVALRDRVRKPVLLAPCFPAKRQKDLEKMTKKGVPSFTIPERAVQALARAVAYTAYRRNG